MKETEVVRCQIQEWYPRFRGVSIATEILTLPEAFISYLLEGDFFVEKGSDAIPARVTPGCPQLQADEYEKWEEEDEEDEEVEERHDRSFPELEAEVCASIERLGGAVVPKLNWSAPKDAVWISTSKSLKCSNFGEISLLLKASDSVVHDMCHAFDNCEDKSREGPGGFVLALRKWYDLRPELEFRAFVRGGFLLGICQREVTGFYPSLLDKEEALEDLIFRFFVEKLCGEFELEDYTFDVYVTRDSRVKLLDFNPWGGSTLPLLFSWDELEEKFKDAVEDNTILTQVSKLTIQETETTPASAEASGVTYKQMQSVNLKAREEGFRSEFRIVESEGLVQPNLSACSGVPLDYIETGPGSAWDEFFRKAEEERRGQSCS